MDSEEQTRQGMCEAERQQPANPGCVPDTDASPFWQHTCYVRESSWRERLEPCRGDFEYPAEERP